MPKAALSDTRWETIDTSHRVPYSARALDYVKKCLCIISFAFCNSFVSSPSIRSSFFIRNCFAFWIDDEVWMKVDDSFDKWTLRPSSDFWIRNHEYDGSMCVQFRFPWERCVNEFLRFISMWKWMKWSIHTWTWSIYNEVCRSKFAINMGQNEKRIKKRQWKPHTNERQTKIHFMVLTFWTLAWISKCGWWLCS